MRPLSVDSTSALTIGFGREEPEYLFERIVAAFRLSDGRIVVVDRGSSEIRYFSPEGEHLLTSGGEGGGPGELEFVMAATWVPGDSIAVLSRRPGVSVYSPTGEFVRQARVTTQGMPARCRTNAGWHLLPDASVLNLTQDNLGVLDCPPMPEGVWRASVQVVRYRLAEAERDTLTIVSGTERVGRNDRVFGRLLALAYSPEWIYMADTGGDSIRTLTPAGKPGPAFATPFPVRDVPASSRTERRRLAKLPDGTVEDLGSFEYPERFPRVGRMLAGRDGQLWVGDYPVIDEPLRSTPVMLVSPKSYQWSTTWRALDGNGAVVAELVTPPDFFPLEFGEDYVLGLTWDDYYVEAIRYYRIRTP